ncbi:DUF2637 domain-containing protein [Streptomyces smyrnaeus]|uniref:DUF2637 domain-containing protein n=1 Tax=Streptomyces TaxID=1883 RepID=UPI000C55DA56|nr:MULTISPECIES: DUF2637 domain-containing protein [unclassified Streptomyces]MBQ0866618.1 DUF2637 domain-containing protein [Streptomyces sp. RK75]MBQ1119038.1 DUF2637 domain-containing protein [Streptomyces sp. B15]MBQ1163147.1 DUF2637 domain-containing protein [Streptomyces sp. A73]
MTETSHPYAPYAPPDPDTGFPGPRNAAEPDLHSAHAYGASPVRNETAARLGLTDPTDTGTLGLTRFASPHSEHGERPEHAEHPDLDAELAHFLDTVEQQGFADSPAALTRARHRKERPLERVKQQRGTQLSWRRILSAFSVTLTAMIVVLVSFLGAKASYPSLYDLAQESAPPSVAHAWPLLIYAPWVAATLSILRTRAYRRRTVHSWLVVLFFAAVASLLCVADAPPTPAGIAVAGLPPITALLCFHQLVRQLDLPPVPTAPSRHARPPRGTNRHRSAG